MAAEGARRFEPWPFALAGALALMIAVCLAFAFVATTRPDPELLPGGERPGLRRAAPGAAQPPLPRAPLQPPGGAADAQR